MVRQLMRGLQGARVPLTKRDLAHRLQADAAVVEDMLDTLVRMGKLERLEEATIGVPDACSHCSAHCGCKNCAERAAQALPRVTAYRIAATSR
jgi:hypothetical protein